MNKLRLKDYYQFIIDLSRSHSGFGEYVNKLVIEYDRGRHVTRVSRDRSVCDTFLIASQLPAPSLL